MIQMVRKPNREMDIYILCVSSINYLMSYSPARFELLGLYNFYSKNYTLFYILAYQSEFC